jgi:hypothetical protein
MDPWGTPTFNRFPFRVIFIWVKVN